MAKILMKGNEALGEAALRAGAIHYFAYPITPQSEVGEYLAKRLPEVGGAFVQAESEVAVGNMLFGAASSGKRVFTRAISYIAGAHLPAVFINVVRGGPGLGGILPAQSDYFQATKGGGHGDYRTLVLAPSTVQEAVDLTMLAFHLAYKYRNPVIVLADGMIGQMMEAVEFPEKYEEPELPSTDEWAITGCKGRDRRIIKSLFLDPVALDKNSFTMEEKYQLMRKNEIRYEPYNIEDDNQILLISYGTMARICQTVIDEMKMNGVSVGLLRPITLFPFPGDELYNQACKDNIKTVMSIEMSTGQMVEDVERFVRGKKPVKFYGRAGGIVPSPEEVTEEIMKILENK
jgi:2-oxoglutarate ferredoxin oxidoreductase subunit alpha